MLNEPIWLPEEEVVDLNREVVSATGEGFALLRPDALYSALARPNNHFYYEGEQDILCLAVTLMFGIARNHPFEQGNKRTGFVAGVMFLRINGYDFPGDSLEFAGDFLKVVNGELDEIVIVERMAPCIVQLAE